MKAYLAALVSLLALDFLFLTFAQKFFVAQVGHLMRLKADGSVDANLLAAAPIYFLLPLGIVYFVLNRSHTLGQAAMNGAFFGLIVYSVYECTNFALLKGWSLPMFTVDIAWGTFLCAVSGLVAQWARTRW